MTVEDLIRGSLFSHDFLSKSIVESEWWNLISDEEVDDLEEALVAILDAFPVGGSPNESQTEDDLIWPILAAFGWTQSLRQQNLSVQGRKDVPDGLLFTDGDLKRRASKCDREWQRYEFGTVLVESKRWLRPLDHGSQGHGEHTAPSTQMLRYLRRVDDLTTGRLRWGILTNGNCWRLYYQGARSVSEDYFEIDFRQLFSLEEYGCGLFAVSTQVRRHCLKVAALVFRRQAFLPGPSDPRTFHQRVIQESRYHEERVAADLSNLVFGRVFPSLARAIAEAAPQAGLDEVRDAALVLLYRLLFMHYAEDRGLLPVRSVGYEQYALRLNVRDQVGTLKDAGTAPSSVACKYWHLIEELSRLIDRGDESLGLPPYDGGLFDRQRVPLLSRIRLSDDVVADLIDALSFERTPDGRRYINYSELSVQQLGSIYERLIEQQIVRNGKNLEVRPNIYARKGSGSYYTSDDLVDLIVDETLGPLVRRRVAAFEKAVAEFRTGDPLGPGSVEELHRLDPAEGILGLRVCDPAMGSGHFLVRVVDYLTDRVVGAIAEAEAAVDQYVSPLTERIRGIRATILKNAKEHGWTVDQSRIDDQHVVRRMVLKRCIFGVDKNPMAVELAKVALWLHTFTVGAPLNFLDHHIRCGNSLFGSWVRDGIEKAKRRGGHLFLDRPLKRAIRSEKAVRTISRMPDSEIAEASRSAKVFTEVQEQTAPLRAFLSLVHAFDWLDVRSRDGKAALGAYYSGTFGDPVSIAAGNVEVSANDPQSETFARLLQEASRLAEEERFLHWQVAFPGVWSDWDADELRGGFDAIVGNPPWDRIKLQQVEWFSSRRPEIAMEPRAADRKSRIAALKKAGDPLADEFAMAGERAKAAARMARNGGDFPLLGRGDINLYSLFVERGMSLINSDGLIGLLTPSGIAGDKTAAKFFNSVAGAGRLRVLFDFENRRVGARKAPYFPSVHRSFKFCAFVASKKPVLDYGVTPAEQPPKELLARCAFFLHDVEQLRDPDRWFQFAPTDFARVNPNTGTAPIFRTRRAANLTTGIYGRLPVIVNRSGNEAVKAWPVKFTQMFHMTNDSGLFRTRSELEEREGAWPVGGNRFQSPSGEWVPLYEGKMVQAFDHRAASIVINPKNLHRPAQPRPAGLEQHQDPNWLPDPQYWVRTSECGWPPHSGWVVGFKEITAPTNVRTFIAALFPAVGFGNKVPVLKPESQDRREWLLAANLNAMVFDFATRQKVQGQTLNLFILEQLPVVPPERYRRVRFGAKTAEEIVREAVLELTYTAHDMAPFAREMGYVDEFGKVRPPFSWSEDRRIVLCAKLDALFFHLYGVTDREDVRYVYSTFPIVEEKETAAYGRFQSRDLCLAYMNALSAGDPDAGVLL